MYSNWEGWLRCAELVGTYEEDEQRMMKKIFVSEVEDWEGVWRIEWKSIWGAVLGLENTG